jgi:hypothetical protein
MNSKPWPSPVRNESGPDEAPANDPIRTLVARLLEHLLEDLQDGHPDWGRRTAGYLEPLRTAADLAEELRERRRRAEQAVEAVEGTALLDLATGIVMARKGGDPESARKTLAAWSRRTGHAVDGLTATEMLGLLTVEEL